MKTVSRHWTVLAIAVLALGLAGCHKKSSSPLETTQPPTGVVPWAWLTGSNVVGRSGIYTSATGALLTPGGRDGSASWIDSHGNLWVFGGVGFDVSGSSGSLNDLWEYQPSTGLWKFVGGSTTVNASGVYGALGAGTTLTTPGARSGASAWIDANDNLWLFGGIGFDGVGTQGDLNDLWEYQHATGTWVWINGSLNANPPGVYQQQGNVAATSVVPGGREGAVSWVDASGNFWLFGGGGYGSIPNNATAANNGLLNDIWKYNPTTNLWLNINGGVGVNAYPVYGTKGTAAATNSPGARTGASGWVDSSGNLWLFGGSGYDVNELNGYLGDLWEFKLPTATNSGGTWTWVGGVSAANGPGVYGTLATPSSSNLPGARASAGAVRDSAGNFWLFGGQGYDGNTNQGYLDDLWEFNLSTGNWQYVSGAVVANPYGVYGTLGTAALTNAPGGRYGASVWIDKSNNIWVFGGGGYDSNSLLGDLNDLWKVAVTP